MKKLTNPKSLNPLLGVLLGVASCAVTAGTINDYDLTQINRYALINNAIFATPDNGIIVGTGVFDPFVRVQAQNGKDTVENGYNTDGRPEQFDTKDQNHWTHSLLLSKVSTKDVNGILYREFFLDINESHGQGEEYLSLDDFRLFLGSVGDLDNYNLTTNTLSGATKVYDMDVPNTNNTVGLNYANFSGSGKGIDLTVLVPDSVFVAANTQPYVYLYSSFGSKGNVVGSNNNNNNNNNNSSKTASTTSLGPLPGTQVSPGALPAGNYGASAGFEEWSSRASIPEPATYWLLGIGLVGVLGLRRRSLR